MKKIFSLLLFGMSVFFLGSCKDDDPAPVKKFADYTRADILAEETNITAEALTENAPNTNFKVGSIIFFKTSDVNWGKLEILEIKPTKELVINIVVYNTAGNVLLSKSNYTLALSLMYFDLDDPTMPAVDSAGADFGWSELGGVRTLIFGNGAKAYLYKP